jgi:hypothetical protein
MKRLLEKLLLTIARYALSNKAVLEMIVDEVIDEEGFADKVAEIAGRAAESTVEETLGDSGFTIDTDNVNGLDNAIEDTLSKYEFSAENIEDFGEAVEDAIITALRDDDFRERVKKLLDKVPA